MRWDDFRRSQNVEDPRGRPGGGGPVRIGDRGGLGTIVMLGLIGWALGIDPRILIAAAVGDDRLQRSGSGRAVPDSCTHGCSEQRVRWFSTGLKSGNIGTCNAFQAQRPHPADRRGTDACKDGRHQGRDAHGNCT